MKDKIVKLIYKAYGTNSGCLFGLKPDQRSLVEIIVRLTLEFENDIINKEKTDGK
jgi:hypothetical protein